MFWKAAYLRQWPLLANSLGAENDVDWKECFISRSRREKNKRIATKGELPVTLCFRFKHKIAEVLEKIAVVKRQLAFEDKMSDIDEDWLPEESQGVEEYDRWMELFIEGTSFSD